MENDCFRWWRSACETFIHCTLAFTFYWMGILSSVFFCVCKSYGIQHFFPFVTHTHCRFYIVWRPFFTNVHAIFPFLCDNMHCTTYLKSYIHLCTHFFFFMRQIKHPISHIICNFLPSFLLLLLSKLYLQCAKYV